MEQTSPIGQAVFHVAVLPARAAYLIAPRSSSGLRRAVQEASTRWGGATEPIIPVRKSGQVEGWWRQVIEISRIDGLVNVDANPGAAARAASTLELPLVELVNVDRRGVTQFTTHPAGIRQDRDIHSMGPAIVARSGGDLWEIVAVGDLTESHEQGAQESRFAVRRPTTPVEIGQAQLMGNTLLDQTLAQFREHSGQGGPWPSPCVLWITTPNAFYDCLWYWNIRALRPLLLSNVPMYLLSERVARTWVGLDGHIRAALARPEDIEPDLIACSRSVKAERLEEMLQQLGLEPSTGDLKVSQQFPAPPLKRGPFTYRVNLDARDFVAFGRSYGLKTDALVQLYSEESVLRAESPVEFVGPGRALVRIGSRAFDGIPRRGPTAKLVHKNADWWDQSLQLMVHATRRLNVTLRVPSLEDSTWALLRSATVKAKLSDKGRLGARLEELALSDTLLGDGVIEIIGRLTTPRSKQMLGELARMRAAGSQDAELAALASTWGGRVERRYRSINDLAGGLASVAGRAAEALASGSWAERGLAVNCDRCSLRGFIPLSVAGARATCPACGAPQQYEASKGPLIQYRLNGLLDRASDQGIVPHLMGFAAMRSVGSHTFLLLGIDVEFSDGTAPEIDLYGVHDGAVVSGEAKTDGRAFTPEQLERDVRLSALLRVDKHLIVSPTGISEDTEKLAIKLTRAANLGLVVVEGSGVRSID